MPAAALRDKIVFVGTTALGTREVVATPLDTLFAGVEVQATVADNLLQQDFIHRPEHGAIARDADRARRSGIVAGAAGRRASASLSGCVGRRAALVARLVAARCGCCRRTASFVSPLFPTLGVGRRARAR